MPRDLNRNGLAALAGRICAAVVICYALEGRAQETNPPSVEAILTKSYENFGGVDSIQFDSKQWHELSKTRAASLKVDPIVAEHTLKFLYDKGRYRADVSLKDLRSKQTRQYVSLSDGHRYQIFEPASRFLTQSNQPVSTLATLAPNPLLTPYAFLSQPGAPIDYQAIRNRELWHEAAKLGQFREVRDEDNRKQMVVRFAVKDPNAKVFRDVYFAEDLGFFPIRMDTYRGGDAKENIVSVVTVDAQKVIEADGRKVIVPLRVTATDVLDGQIMQRVDQQIIPESITLKPDAPDELFSIPPAQARIVQDGVLHAQIAVGTGDLQMELDEPPAAVKGIAGRPRPGRPTAGAASQPAETKSGTGRVPAVAAAARPPDGRGWFVAAILTAGVVGALLALLVSRVLKRRGE